MAITFDVATSDTGTTFNHTVGGGSNSLLVVVTSSANGSQSTPTVSFNGVSMGAPQVSESGASTTNQIYLFTLVAPAAGTHSVVIGNVGSDHCTIVSSYFGVDQVTPIGNTAHSGAGFLSSISNSITVAAGNWAVDGVKMEGQVSGGRTFSVNGSQTQLGNLTSNLSLGRTGSSYLLNATAMGWTFSGQSSDGANQVVAEINAAGGAAAPTPNQNDAVALTELTTPNLINMPKVFN